MRKLTLRLMTTLAAGVIAVAAFGQQAAYAQSGSAALAAAPGYAFRIDLKLNFNGFLYWEFRIAGKDGLGHLVRVAVPSAEVKRNTLMSIDSRTPRSGLDYLTAGANAVAAASAQLGVDSQIVRFEATPRSNGTIRYRVYLNVLGDGGGMVDQDLEVTLDSNGNVKSIVQNDD